VVREVHKNFVLRRALATWPPWPPGNIDSWPFTRELPPGLRQVLDLIESTAFLLGLP